MKILITGSNGLLGQKIVKQCLNNNIDFLATSKGVNRNIHCPHSVFAELDITNHKEICSLFNEYQPTHVIHTAAITNVDQCELNPAECQETNVDAVNSLFREAKSRGAHFQLLSTDFVFNGKKGNYNEEDQVDPLSVYAQSKVDGELILKNDSYTNWSIVRTIIVYGIGENLSRNNIVCWAKEALSSGQEMKIVDDQFRAPTWADDLAWACLQICRQNELGVFHIAGPETMSIYDIVLRVAKHFNYSTASLSKVSSTELSQPAKRPPKTGFDLEKARTILGYNPKTLEETLDLI
jgi:dTDP-4-dehydrorhamnose reductase